EKRILRLAGDRAGAEAQAAENDRALEAAGKEYQALTDGIREAEADLIQLVKQQSAAENSLTALRDEMSGRQKQIGEKESRLRVLEEMQQAYEGFHKGVREVLKAGKTGKLRGVCGVVAELLQVPEEYALAVEVALGGAVQFIVTETDRDAQEAIEFLKTGKAGRATFLPLNTIKGNGPDKSLEQVAQAKNCLGTAADLVKIDGRYNNILQFLLGRIAVFKNLEQARQAAKATGYRYKFVTLEGEIINAGGSFTGGSFARGNTGLLGRTGEIESLKKDIRQLQKELAKLHAAETGLQGELAGIIDTINKNRAQTQEKFLKMTGAAKDLEQRQSDQERINRLTFSINMEIDQENNELSRIGKKREELKVQLAQLVKKNEDLQENIGRLQDELKGHQEKKEQINALITASRVRLASLEQEAAGFEQLLARANNAVQELKQQAVNKKEELARVDVTKSKIDEEISALKEQSVKQLEEKGAAGERLNLLKAERNSDAAALDECDSSCKQMQKQLGRLQEQIHSIDIRRARLEMEVDNARQRLMEEHGLTFEEALLKKTEINNRREVTTRIKELKSLIAGLGIVNLGAIEEYNRVKERFEFLSAQHNDLEEARISLYKVIEEMDGLMTRRFKEAYENINANFSETFNDLFGGGNAELQLTNSDDLLETGIEIVAQPPGKKPQHLSLLSGGERALTAIALLFAILKAKPSPFCVLDEIEAALDEANVDRFAGFLREFARETQFIVVTHRKGTMEVADVLYGVTMDESGVTKLVSMRLADTVDKVS
ncbi:MAG: chromosome segregation protein SMC, partial [Bacillota bacterium]